MTTEVTHASATQPIVMGGEPNVVVANPVVETDPAVVVDPAVVAPAADVVDPNIAPKVTPKWAQDRINELTFKRHEAERKVESETKRAQDATNARVAAEARAAELLAQIAAKAGGDPAVAPTVKAAPSEEEINKMVEDKAMQIAANNRFNEACNDIVATGKAEFKDSWDEAIKNLGLVGAIGQNVSPEFLETAIELKNPAKILHHLGSNLDEAERIAKLPGKKMAMELARIEAQLNAPAVVVAPALSNAPAPVITVGGAAKAGAPDITDPNISMDDYVALRQKQVDERRKRYQRV